MSDVSGYFASLYILMLFTRKILRTNPTTKFLIIFGLVSGLAIFIRESVWASILAICISLLSMRKIRELLAYVLAVTLIPMTWNIYTTINYNLNYFTGLSTAMSLSLKYSGAIYNPFKVLGYLLDGLTPFHLIFILLWIVNETNRERFKFLHLVSLPFFLAAALWPGLYEPRIAIVVLPATAPLIGYGANELINRISSQPIYRRLGRGGLEFIILASYLLFNILMAYLNNGLRFSYIFSESIR